MDDGDRWIRFQGKKYVKIGGAIATQDAFESGECSYAHLFSDGKIRRHGDVIGTESDIEDLGPYEADIDRMGGFFDGIQGDTWNEKAREAMKEISEQNREVTRG